MAAGPHQSISIYRGSGLVNGTAGSSGDLKRTFGLVTLVAFGLGDILGAGIYGLIGKIAGTAGYACWLSFMAALVVAALTGLSYAELSGRLPRSGGEAYFAHRAFRRPALASIVGFMVLLSGIVSVSTVSHIFGGYFAEMLKETVGTGAGRDILSATVRIVFLIGVALVTFWGIRQSSAVNVICTLIEVSGLLVVIVVGLSHFGSVNYFDFTPGNVELDGKLALGLVLSGGVLAFYSFIGFEDLVNVSEEVKDPRRHMPKAILIALAIAAVMYGLVAIAAVSVVAPAELFRAEAPLMLVLERGISGISPETMTTITTVFGVVALFAVTNTALVNFVMGSRLVYGMARQELLPPVFGRVHARRGTPDVAIAAMLVVTILLTLLLTRETLGGTTSVILLTVFFVVNLSLVVLKMRQEPTPANCFTTPMFVPILGAAAAVTLVGFAQEKAFHTVSIITLIGLALTVILLVFREGRAPADAAAPDDLNGGPA